MVEQDPVAGEHSVRLTVIHRDPVAVELGDAVRRTRIERRRLLLRNLLHQAIQLGCGGLIKSRVPLHAEDADRLEKPEHAEGIRVRGVFGAFEADRDMALGREIVDLGRTDLLHQADQIGGIRHVAVMHQKRHIAAVRILVKMIDPGSIEGGGAALDAVDGVAEREQVLGEIGAILSGDTCYQRHAPFFVVCRHLVSNRSKRGETSPGHGSEAQAIASASIEV